MKIAIMMRAIDQDSGFQAYVNGLIEAMLQLNTKDEFLLLYRKPKWIGRFEAYPNVKEALLKAPNKLLWDQAAVPYRAWSEKADVIFNPKFTVPFVSHCPVVMGLQEPAWWTEPEYYEKFNAFYQKLMLPLYCRKANHLLPMAYWILNENRKYLKLPLLNTTVTHPAPHKHLVPVTDVEQLNNFKKKYNLPDKFILSVTRVDHPGLDNSTSFYPGKNPQTTLKAFLQIKDQIPHHLVVAGRRVKEFFQYYGFKEEDFDRVHFYNFMPFEKIQNLFSLADLTVVPTFYEGFGFTLMASLACGCPAVASVTGACSEVVGDAAPLADPRNPSDFAQKMLRILKDDNLRRELKIKSINRMKNFTWEKTAEITLEVLHKVLNNTHSGRKHLIDFHPNTETSNNRNH